MSKKEKTIAPVSAPPAAQSKSKDKLSKKERKAAAAAGGGGGGGSKVSVAVKKDEIDDIFGDDFD